MKIKLAKSMVCCASLGMLCASAMSPSFKPDTCLSQTVPGEAPSLLPSGRKFKLVWHDEFNGTRLDETKWSYRTNFWGQNAHWFAKPEDNAVEISDGFARLKLIRRPDGQFVSPQLQTGEIVWDIPAEKNRKRFWPLGKRSPAKFQHRYGFYECRARLQQEPGWWSAFWMQTETQGTCLDPSRAGIEHDIMESFEPGVVIPSAFLYNGYGADNKTFFSPRLDWRDKDAKERLSVKLDKTAFHTFALLWEPDGYTLFIDGKARGPKVGDKGGEAVSQVPEFILITTEAKWYRRNLMKGDGVKELPSAAARHDEFVVDYVRVYDIVPERVTPSSSRPGQPNTP